MPVELAPVRAGEELPWDRLEAYLAPAARARRRDARDDRAAVPQRLGQPHLPAHVRRPAVRAAPAAVRRDRAGRPRHDARAPGAVAAVAAVRPRAAGIRAVRTTTTSSAPTSSSVEYRSGEVVWASLPPSMADLPDAGQPHRAGHRRRARRPAPRRSGRCGLADLGRPDGFLDRQLAGWRKRWELVASARARRRRWTRPPPSSPAAARRRRCGTFLHNDFKLDNCQFAPGEPDRVTSVFDWDMATLGDPFVDFGTLLNYWPDPSDTPDDRALHVPGMERIGLPTARRRRRALRRSAPVSTSTTSHWYEAFACWRRGVICQQLLPALRARREHRRAHGQPWRQRRDARQPGARGSSPSRRGR